MASYRGHLMLAAPLGLAYGSLALGGLGRRELDWGPPLLAAGLTTLGGLLPDLDSDSGVPVRELFGVTAALVPAFLCQPLLDLGLPLEQTVVLLALAYLAVKFPLATAFKHWTVHRGMFHSIPAMFIAGLVLYLSYPNPDAFLRLYLAGGVMLGFASHLILDEFYAIDFNGLRFRQNKFAGSAFKFVSPSYAASIATYVLLAGLSLVAWTGGTLDFRWPSSLPRPAWLAGPSSGGGPPHLSEPEHQRHR